MTHETVISILFAFDRRYAQHGAACIASILRSTKARLEIVVATTDNPETFAPEFRRSFADQERLDLKFINFAIPTDTSFPTPYYLTRDSYVRFWAHQIFPDRSRVIYIDPDTIVTSSLVELWETDLKGKAVGAVPIPNSTRPMQHGMQAGSLYFNSGVLLMDLDAWRERNYCDRCLTTLQEHAHRVIDPDQDVLNICLQGDWLQLDYTWNAINPFFRPSHDLGLPADTIKRVRAQAKIIHFNGISKPWVYLDNHPRQREYFDHLAMTAWSDWRPDDRTPLNVCRKTLQPLAPQWLRRQIKKTVQAAAAFHKPAASSGITASA